LERRSVCDLGVWLPTELLEPNAENASEAELLAAMEAAPNKRSYRRLAAVRALCKGFTRLEVAELFGCSERMVRLWVVMFNRGGIDGLTSKPRSGRPRKVKLEKLHEVLVPVLEDPSQAGEVHWTGVKLHGWLKEQLALDLGYRTTIRYLHELDYKLLVPQPWPEKQDWLKRTWFAEQIEALEKDPGIELWYGDECGVEGDPRPKRRWAARGSRPQVPYLGTHLRSNVVGAVCPKTGESFTMLFDGVDADVFQCFLDCLAEALPPDPSKQRILILDNASWHKAKRLNWHHFECMFLPAYSPDFNPIERLWLRLKADYFTDFIAHTKEQLLDRLCTALNAFMDDKALVAAQCAIRR
jgi:transposase